MTHQFDESHARMHVVCKRGREGRGGKKKLIRYALKAYPLSGRTSWISGFGKCPRQKVAMTRIGFRIRVVLEISWPVFLGYFAMLFVKCN